MSRIAALSLESELAAQVLQVTEDTVVVADEDPHVCAFNHSAELMFGYGAEEVLGQGLSMLMPARFAERHRHCVAEFPAEITISKIQMGKKVLLAAIIRDISQLKQIEETLRASESKCRQLFDEASVANVVLDAETTGIPSSNPATSALLGYSREELSRLTAHDVTSDETRPLGPGIRRGSADSRSCRLAL